jgi:hypothetical protein
MADGARDGTRMSKILCNAQFNARVHIVYFRSYSNVKACASMSNEK